jgi:hypothetical protein
MSGFDEARKTNEMARAAPPPIPGTCTGTGAAIQGAMRIAVALAVLVISTSIAAAQAPGETMSWEPDPVPPSAVAPQSLSVSYRSDILLADGLSLGLVLLGPVAHHAEI